MPATIQYRHEPGPARPVRLVPLERRYGSKYAERRPMLPRPASCTGCRGWFAQKFTLRNFERFAALRCPHCSEAGLGGWTCTGECRLPPFGQLELFQ